ncbi:MAG: hypothetical protein J1G02_03060 [Clostridiales bacterium]|nr:hypothetical protein [Clostridiales bacterium]
MAEKKSENNNKKKKTRSTTVWSLNKISFYLIVATAILYLVAMILSCIGTRLAGPVRILQDIATAIMICVVAILAYRYIRNKPKVWLVLYIVVLLVVLVGIVIPLIMLW